MGHIKSQSQLLFPFKYKSKPSNGDCYGINQDEIYDFLPYVRSFFNDQSVKQLSILPITIPSNGMLCFKPSVQNFADHLMDLSFQSAQIYFFDKNIAILVITLPLTQDLTKESISRMLKSITNINKHNDARIVYTLAKKTYSIVEAIEDYENTAIFGNVKVYFDKKNNHTVVNDFRINPGDKIDNNIIQSAVENNKKKFYTEVEKSPNIKEWIVSLIDPYIDNFEEANFLNHSRLILYSVLLLNEESNIESFIEALLFGYEYHNDGCFSAASLIEVIQKNQYSSKIDVYSNLNGVVVIGRDETNEYMKNSYFDQFTKNVMLIYSFVILQKSRLIQLISNADRMHMNGKNYNFKDELLEYLVHIDFTQLSNNPGRNKIYKFFRETNSIKDLLEETKTITDSYTREEEIADRLNEQQKTRRLELGLAFLGIIGAIVGIYGVEIKSSIEVFLHFFF